MVELFGIIAFNKNISIYFRRIKWKYLKELIIIAISANLILFPIIILNFNTISTVFLLANILASPLLAIIIIFGFIIVFISVICFPIAMFLGYFLNICLEILLLITKFCSNIPFSKIYVTTPNILLVIIYYIFLFIVNSYMTIRMKGYTNFFSKKFIILCINFKNRISTKKILCIILILALILNIVKLIPTDLKVYFIDVEQR